MSIVYFIVVIIATIIIVCWWLVVHCSLIIFYLAHVYRLLIFLYLITLGISKERAWTITTITYQNL